MDIDVVMIAQVIAAVSAGTSDVLLKVIARRLRGHQISAAVPAKLETKKDLKALSAAIYALKRQAIPQNQTNQVGIPTTEAQGAKVETRSPKPGGVALEVLNDFNDSGNTIRQERIRQARTAFNLAVGFLSLGVIIHIAGIVVILLGTVPRGLGTVALGLLPDGIGATLFKFNRETNDRLDVVSKDMYLIEKAREGMDHLSRITDDAIRNEAIRELTQSLHGPDSNGGGSDRGPK